MTSSNATMPFVYLDTCVISGVVNGDMPSSDSQGFVRMTTMARDSALSFCASTVAREEIDKIPPEFRRQHVEQYESLRIVRASDTTWIDTDRDSTGYGQVTEHPDYARLRGILRDENDARHLFHAKMAGVSDVVTVDYNSILNKAEELREGVGINVFSPSGYVSSRLSS